MYKINKFSFRCDTHSHSHNYGKYCYIPYLIDVLNCCYHPWIHSLKSLRNIFQRRYKNTKSIRTNYKEAVNFSCCFFASFSEYFFASFSEHFFHMHIGDGGGMGLNWWKKWRSSSIYCVIVYAIIISKYLVFVNFFLACPLSSIVKSIKITEMTANTYTHTHTHNACQDRLMLFALSSFETSGILNLSTNLCGSLHFRFLYVCFLACLLVFIYRNVFMCTIECTCIV